MADLEVYAGHCAVYHLLQRSGQVAADRATLATKASIEPPSENYTDLAEEEETTYAF